MKNLANSATIKLPLSFIHLFVSWTNIGIIDLGLVALIGHKALFISPGFPSIAKAENPKIY